MNNFEDAEELVLFSATDVFIKKEWSWNVNADNNGILPPSMPLLYTLPSTFLRSHSMIKMVNAVLTLNIV
jgi:hypothetical protein